MHAAKRLLLGLLFAAACLSAAAEERYFSAALTFPLGFRLGCERPLGARTAVKADLGLEMLQLPAADLFFLIHLLPPEHRMRLDLALGIPTAMTAAEFQPLHLYPMFSLGGSLIIGWPLKKGRSLDLRLGGGVPFFFGEEDKPVLRPMRFPSLGGEGEMELYFWPDLALGMSFSR